MGRNVWGMLIAGAVLLIAAVAWHVIAVDHMPIICDHGNGGFNSAFRCSGWTKTTYDAVRIASWACGIVGVILVAVGLIRVWRTSQPSTSV